MVVPRVTEVMIDCRDRKAMTEFWTELLDIEVRQDVGQFTFLSSQVEGGWGLALQEVDDPTPGKNKLHLDGACEDLEALGERVEQLGGSIVQRHSIDGFEWWVFADVEENVFCFGRPT
ncbi:MAG: VOC family protein [Acidimicrobiia bacterium]|nr:VOC family protein [Acidimicrobiia bacterium]